jgi:hypothetical protein
MPGGRQQQDVRNFQTFTLHGRILIEFRVFSETVAILACGATCVNSAKPLHMQARSKVIAQVLVIDDRKIALT